MITQEVVRMTLAPRDAAFAAFVDRDRPLLLGSAYLILGDGRRAREKVETILAQAYRDWPRMDDARAACFQALLLEASPVGPQPWRRPGGFELLDTTPATTEPPDDIVAQLGLLPKLGRELVVLEHYAGLRPAACAALTGTDPARVRELSRSAREILAEYDQSRAEDRHLRAELAAAVRHELGSELSSSDDLPHGRMLLRRRRLLRGLVAASVAVVLAVTAGQVLGGRVHSAGSGIGPAAGTGSASPSEPACSVSDAGCRVQVTRSWRDGVSRVSRSYLDPDRAYFTGYSYSYDRSYDSDALWAGRGGALGLDLFKLENGATQVFVQIATAEKFAARCGKATSQSCVTMRFMDGNLFTLTETTHVSEGIEVQYSPDGGQVITLVARNVSRGNSIDITRGELIALVQDPRLRLPRV
jgi:hypothetical protein